MRIARDAGLPVATLAIAWSLTHDFVGSTIIGATAPEQLTDTLAGSGTALPADVLAACNEVSKDIRYPLGRQGPGGVRRRDRPGPWPRPARSSRPPDSGRRTAPDRRRRRRRRRATSAAAGRARGAARN